LLSSSTAVASAEGPYDQCIWQVVYFPNPKDCYCVLGGSYCCTCQ